MLKTIARAVSIAAAFILLAGCGGSNTSSSVAGGGSATGTDGGDAGGTSPEIIRGVATPSSVAVVTATNAN